MQARVKELEDASTKQKRALAESEKHRLRLHKLSKLNQSTLQSVLESGEKMVKDMELLEERAAAAQT